METTCSPDRRWTWDFFRAEFIRDGVGHPPCWAANGIHGCDGGCSDPSFPGRRPKAGDIALCGAGFVGVIISDKQHDVVYPDGNISYAWVGVHLGPNKEGRPWSSRNPAIIGRAEDMLPDETLRQFVMRTKPHGWKPVDSWSD